MTGEGQSTKMMNSITSWFKKNWKWLKWVLIVPVVLGALVWIARWVVILLSSDKPDLGDLERDLRRDENKMDDEERKIIDKNIKERDKMLDNIDDGSPTPAEVFDKELEDDD